MVAVSEKGIAPLLEGNLSGKAEGERTTVFLPPRYRLSSTRDRVDAGSFRGNSGDNVSQGAAWSPRQYTMYVYFSTDAYVFTAVISCLLLFVFGCMWWSYCKNKLRTSPAAQRQGERGQQQAHSDRDAPDCFASSSVDSNPGPRQCDDKGESGIVCQHAAVRTLRPAEDIVEWERGGKSTSTAPEEADEHSVQAVRCENPDRKGRTRVSPSDCDDTEPKDVTHTAADDRNKDTAVRPGCQINDNDDDSQVNKLGFDEDRCGGHRLLSVEDDAEDELKETSPLMEDVDNFSEYLANFSLPFTPCKVTIDDKEGHDSMTGHVRGSSREGGEELATTEESFSFAHKVTAHPECSPYHLAWFTPLPRSKLSVPCSTSTRKRIQLHETDLQVPFTSKRHLEVGADDMFDTTASTPQADPSPKRQQTCEENISIPQAADSRTDERDSGLSSIFVSQLETDVGQAYSGGSSFPFPGDADDARKIRKSYKEHPVFTNAHPLKLCICQPVVPSRLAKTSIPEEGDFQNVSSTPRIASGSDFASLLRSRLACRTPKSAAPSRAKSRSVRVASARSRPPLTFLHPKGKASLSEGCLVDKPLCTSSAKNLVELAIMSPAEGENEKTTAETFRSKGSLIVDDSLLWDSFPFRSASESLIWDNDMNTEAMGKKGDCF